MSKLKLFIYIIILSCSSILYSQDSNPLYAVAVDFTPVLNTPDYDNVFGGATRDSLKLDDQGLIREMEFIAFPNTVFEIIEKIPKGDHSIFKVVTEDYPYKSSSLYVDSRFVEVTSTKPEDRVKKMPGKSEILQNIIKFEGYGYMWGGNYAVGIERMLTYYKPSSEIDTPLKNKWSLKGVDCSGLIYEATNGSTPRNTSSLIKYGRGLEIAGKTADEISGMLEPLDLIAWNGHVIIVLDKNTVIESTPDKGVHKTDLMKRIGEVMNERLPVNDWEGTEGLRFVVRRWAE
ncbi:MAG: peptidoglycan endopeptidase [Bacteroidetes bacterium]|nr:peptidoglycan endopeptidase [Bacteroidota bacterium]